LGRMWPSRTRLIAMCVFLPRRVSSAIYALACFIHETKLQGTPSFAASLLEKGLATEKKKEDFAPKGNLLYGFFSPSLSSKANVLG